MLAERLFRVLFKLIVEPLNGNLYRKLWRKERIERRRSDQSRILTEKTNEKALRTESWNKKIRKKFELYFDLGWGPTFVHHSKNFWILGKNFGNNGWTKLDWTIFWIKLGGSKTFWHSWKKKGDKNWTHLSQWAKNWSNRNRISTGAGRSRDLWPVETGRSPLPWA